MPEYAKMKNADLEALLKDRGLPTGGKKADMVDRLSKDDETKEGVEVNDAPASTAPAAILPEDEIDWDDDAEDAAATKATTGTDPAVAKAGGTGPADNPQDVPNQVADIDPSKTDDLSVKEPGEEGAEAEVAKEKEPTPDYTKGLAASSTEDEIKKRKARAERFGLKIDDNDELKKLERAQKFGGSAPPKGLDEALPERSRKRGRDNNDEGGRGRDKRRGGGRQGGGRRGRGDRDNRGNRDNRGGDSNRSANGGPAWMSESDRKKAEERKAKWGASAAS